jgi:hypothetical protein
MKKQGLSLRMVAAWVLMPALLLVGCTVSAQSHGGDFFFRTKGKPQDPGIVLDRLSGGDESLSRSGRVVSETFNIRDFSKVEVSHAFQVDIVQGDSYRVMVRVDDNLERHLRVEKRGDTLIIGLKPLRGFNLRRATMEAEIRMPGLTGIEVSGASDVKIGGFISNKNFDLEDFPVVDAKIELSGATEAEVVLRGTLDIDVSGASRLYYGGNPTIRRIDLSGASSIKRR